MEIFLGFLLARRVQNRYICPLHGKFTSVSNRPIFGTLTSLGWFRMCRFMIGHSYDFTPYFHLMFLVLFRIGFQVAGRLWMPSPVTHF